MSQGHLTKFNEIGVEFKGFKRNYLGGFEAQGSSFHFPLWPTSTDDGDSSGELLQSGEPQRYTDSCCAWKRRRTKAQLLRMDA